MVGPKGRTVFEIPSAPRRQLVHRPPLVVAAAPPPPHAVARRNAAALSYQSGRIPVSCLASPRPRATRASGGRRHWSPAPAARRARHDVGDAYLVLCLRSPPAAPTWRNSSCARCAPLPAMGREIRRPTRSVGLTARAVLRHRLARQIDGFGSRLEERAACAHLRRSAEAGRPAGRPPPCSAPWTLCPELANRMSFSLLLNDEPARPPASSIGSHLPPRLSAGAAPSGSGLRCGTTPSSRALPGEATGDGEDDRIPDWADPA